MPQPQQKYGPRDEKNSTSPQFHIKILDEGPNNLHQEEDAAKGQKQTFFGQTKDGSSINVWDQT